MKHGREDGKDDDISVVTKRRKNETIDYSLSFNHLVEVGTDTSVLLNIPKELWMEHVLKELTIRDRSNLRLVCRGFLWMVSECKENYGCSPSLLLYLQQINHFVQKHGNKYIMWPSMSPQKLSVGMNDVSYLSLIQQFFSNKLRCFLIHNCFATKLCMEDLLLSLPRTVESLTIENLRATDAYNGPPSSSISSVSKISNLRSLKFKSVKYITTDDVMHVLPRNLTSLCIFRCVDVNFFELMKGIQMCHTLLKLDIEGLGERACFSTCICKNEEVETHVKPEDEHEMISILPQSITSLSLKNVEKIDTSLVSAMISRLTSLKQLKISKCKKVEGSFMSSLPSTVTKLVMRSTYGFNGDTLYNTGFPQNLVNLNLKVQLYDYYSSTELLPFEKFLQCLPKDLKVLKLTYPSSISGKGIKPNLFVTNIPQKLERLDIYSTFFDPHMSINHLEMLPSTLTALHINKHYLTRDAIDLLNDLPKHLPFLKHLAFTGVKPSQSMIQSLSHVSVLFRSWNTKQIKRLFL